MKIGLLDQYTGANLGDAAILEAMIENIRQRHPKAKIFLFTLYPEETERRHEIKSFSITGFRLLWYSDCSSVSSKMGIDIVSREGLGGPAKKIWRWIKKSSRMGRPIKHMRSFLGTMKKIYDEIIHIGRSYKILKGFDLLIVSGGGQLDDDYGGPWGHPYTLFKWALLAKATGTKLIFLSVGTCSIGCKISEYFLKLALKNAQYRSFRDTGSKDRWARFKFTQNDYVFPDLAFSYSAKGASGGSICQIKNGTLVGISAIAYLSSNWPKRNIGAFEKYKQCLTDFTAHLIAAGYSVMLFTTDDMDRQVNEEVMLSLRYNLSLHDSDKLRMAQTYKLDDLVHELRIADYILASRLHGILISHVLGKPVVAISYDRKVDAHMVNMKQQEYSVDILKMDCESLMKKYRMMESNKANMRSQIEQQNGINRTALGRQYDLVLGNMNECIQAKKIGDWSREGRC